MESLGVITMTGHADGSDFYKGRRVLVTGATGMIGSWLVKALLAQDAQAASVQDIYDPPDVTVARQQEVKARQILDYISTVRQDSYASSQEKTAWIAAIPDLALSPDTIDKMRKRIEYDLEYLRHWSLRLDLVIVWRTFWQAVRGDRNAY